MKTKPKSLGKTLSRLRTAKDWTQADLAKRSKVSQAAISKIEAGKCEPSVGIARQLAKALTVSLDYLFSCRTGVDKYSKRNKVTAVETKPRQT